MNRTSTSRALAVVVGGLSALIALSGCAGAGSGATTPAATPASTVTVTAAPAATASPDDPIDALGAWTACAVLGQAEYAAANPGSELRPYDPAHPPTKNADGTFQAVASYSLPTLVEGAKSMLVICTIGGTLGHPTLVHWLLKDV